MPFIKIQLVEGRTNEQKEKTAKEITKIVVDNLGVPSEKVYVIFEEMQEQNYYPKGEKLNH